MSVAAAEPTKKTTAKGMKTWDSPWLNAKFLVGLGIICLGGFITLNTFWNGNEKTIAADIGYRLVATGYVIAVTSGMADVFGFGNQPFPAIPYFGPWQAIGVMVGQITIALGFLLMIPIPQKARKPV